MIVELLHLMVFYALGLGFVHGFGPADADRLQKIALAPALGLALATLIAFFLALIPGGAFMPVTFEILLFGALVLVWVKAGEKIALKFSGFLPLLPYLAVPVMLVGLWIFQENMHLAIMTYDSHRFVGLATDIVLNSGNLLSLESLSMATGYPLPLALGLSLGTFWGGDYFRLLPAYLLLPVILCLPAILLAYAKDIGLGVRNRLFLTLGMMALVLSTGTLIYFTFYVNSNSFSAAFLISAAAVLWFQLRRPEQNWLVVSGILVTFLATTRLEAALLSFLLLLFVIGFRSQSLDRSFIKFIFVSCGIQVAWLGFLFVFASGGSIVSNDQLLMMAVLLAGLPIMVLIFEKVPVTRPLGPVLPIVTPIGLGIILVLFYILRPEQMNTSLMSMATNMFWISGLWTSTWPGLVLFATFLIFVGARIDHTSLFFGALFVSIFFLINDLSFFRIPYRIGFGDSGNRMLLSIVPMGWLTVGILVARYWTDLTTQKTS